MRLSPAAVVAAVALLGAGVLAGAGATATSLGAAVHVFDRTFSCEAGYVGGLYQVGLSAALSVDAGSSRLRASTAVTRNMHDAALGSLGWDGVSVHRGYCTPSKARVRLTTKGLRGGAVPPLGREANCETARRVLLRVRASFARPVTARTHRTFGFPQLTVPGNVQQAALAVASPTGTTVAYLAVTGTDKARLFTRPHCKED